MIDGIDGDIDDDDIDDINDINDNDDDELLIQDLESSIITQDIIQIDYVIIIYHHRHGF